MDIINPTAENHHKLSELRQALEDSGHNISQNRLIQMIREGKLEAFRLSERGIWYVSTPEFDRMMRERGGKPARVKPNHKRKPQYSNYDYIRFVGRRYGLTPERYQELLDEQDGKCAICRCDPKVKYSHLALNQQRLHVDHWHDDTTAVRGLLCGNCNFGVGRWLDNPQLLKAAIRYLDKHLPLRFEDSA